MSHPKEASGIADPGAIPTAAAPLSLPQRIIEAHASEALARLDAVGAITHPGELGRAREEVLRQYLREIVPEGFRVATGFVIDSAGGQSRQQDLIIVRREYHPRFQIGGAEFFPVESVAAVIEVKSDLSSKSLASAIENVRSVKALDRTGGGNNLIIHGGAGGVAGGSVDATNHYHQVFAMIISARCSTSAEAAYITAARALQPIPRCEWVNAIAAADAWFLAYHVPGGKPRTQTDIATGMRLYSRSDERNVDPLVDVASDLWSWLRVAPLIDAAPLRYVQTSTHFLPAVIPDLTSPMPNTTASKEPGAEV